MKKQIINLYLTQRTLTTDADLKLFITALGTPVLGTKVNCGREDHTSPFRVVSDIITMRTTHYVVWANRSGSKTYSVGGFPSWYKSIRYPRLQTKILGGSKDQSTLSYEAMKYFFDITDTYHYLRNGELFKQRADFGNNSEVSILTASTRSVRGPHPQTLLLDEVDEMAEDVFEDALSQPQTKHGIPPSLGMFSTNHQVEGLMDKAIAMAQEKEQAIYRYCIWECLESCRDYSCSTCPLSSECPGIHMKEADGYYKISDFIDKLNTMSYEALQRDWFCNKIGFGDCVYENEYSEERNLVGVNLRPDIPVTLSIDWGGADPFAVGVYQPAPENGKFPPGSWIKVTELYMTSVDKSVHNGIVLAEAKKRPWFRQIREIIYDSGRPDLASEWRVELPGCRFIKSDKREIDDGIECVKAALHPVMGPPRLYINRICADTRREFKTYRKKKISETDYKIIDANNHAMDETRYFCKEKMGKAKKGFFGVMEHDVMPE